MEELGMWKMFPFYLCRIWLLLTEQRDKSSKNEMSFRMRSIARIPRSELPAAIVMCCLIFLGLIVWCNDTLPKYIGYLIQGSYAVWKSMEFE